MSSSLDYGRKILMTRMIRSLEGEGYRVEFAEEYQGYIVAGQGDDPAVMLLEADAIEKMRLGHPGNAAGFVSAVVQHVQSNISAQGSASIQPQTAPEEAAAYADVPSAPPDEFAEDVPRSLEEVPVESVPVDDAPVEQDEAPPDEEPPPEEPAPEADEDQEFASEEIPIDDAMADVPVEALETQAPAPEAGEEAPEPDEKERMDAEVTEQLSVDDLD